MPVNQSALTQIRLAVEKNVRDLAPGARIVVGLSGGADSMTLLAAATRVATVRGLVCTAVVVDHGLQSDSSVVAVRAADQARILGCGDSRVVRVQVPTSSDGPEAAARAVRRAALLSVADEDPSAEAILLGHTRDDQAETVLLALARGSGTRSLAGMAVQSGRFRRPILALPREVIAQASAELIAMDHRLQPWQDPHNADPRYARSRVRATVLPVLVETLGPAVLQALARTARLARADADALDEWVSTIWHTVSIEPHSVPVGVLFAHEGKALPEAITTRLVRRFLLASGAPDGRLSAGHVWSVVELLGEPARSRAHVALPGGLSAQRVGEHLVVRPSASWKPGT